MPRLFRFLLFILLLGMASDPSRSAAAPRLAHDAPSVKQEVVPLALQYRQQALTAIEAGATFPLIADAVAPSGMSRPVASIDPTIDLFPLAQTDPLFGYMSLQI